MTFTVGQRPSTHSMEGLEVTPLSYPGLQRIAGLQVWRTHSVALLQLCNAVPIIQLLRLILASTHIEAVPSYGGQGVRANMDAATHCLQSGKTL